MKTCVIGGGGFIGKYLVDILNKTGRDVRVIGRRAQRPDSLDPSVEYLQCDYVNRTELKLALAGCDEVIDLAYATVPQTSFSDPIFDLQANLAPSVNLLIEATELGEQLRRLVIVSSGGTVYGPVSRLPIIEDDPTFPISPYGITKLTIERYALMFYRLSGLPVSIARPANAYGLGQKPFIGQGFIATAMGKILQEEDVLVFGQEGTVRDYIHVKDVASGILRVLEKGRPGEIYNLGSGVGRSNREILDAIEPLACRDGFEVRVTSTAPRGFDVPTNVLSYGKLLSETNWQPQVPFSEGLAEMWDGIKQMVKNEENP